MRYLGFWTILMVRCNGKMLNAKKETDAGDEAFELFERKLKSVCRDFEIESIDDAGVFLEEGYGYEVRFRCNGESLVTNIFIIRRYSVEFGEVELA